MKQILQNLGSGETTLAEIPAPRVQKGHLLIKTEASLVSLGTERMLVSFGRASWLEKARMQPEKVRQVWDKIRTDGLLPTLESVRNKLDQPLPLGYCNAGIVLEMGSGVTGFAPGDRVISNGPHAEVVSVPRNLCAKIPDGVEFEEAAFTVLASIGLQGVRLLQPTLGESIAVTGLGLIGLLTVQILKAQGCRVLGIDFDSGKCALARQFGAETVDLSKGEDPVTAGIRFSNGRGMDGVLIAASTESNDPIHQAALMSRKRGRIVLVGVTGLALSRADFYEKELTFQVSCSYGPGRYDEAYETLGQDYPLGYVRWTEQRNFEAVLALLGERRLQVGPLITCRFPFTEALKAYADENLKNSLGIVLQYEPGDTARTRLEQKVIEFPTLATTAVPEVVVGVIGAGNFTGQVLLPALRATGARLKMIASAGGVTGTHLARKFGFETSTTDAENVLADSEINSVLITTRHSSHARYVLAALKAGKRVFVEKPLCVHQSELREIADAYHDSALNPFLLVGFNRRFAPHVTKIKSLLASVAEPKSILITVNAGWIPPTHWAQQPGEGGRIIGEGCHFIDLCRHLVGHPILSVESMYLGMQPNTGLEDKMLINLKFEDGSIASVHYLANGHKAFPKERVEIFCAGRILQLENFRVLKGWGWPGFSKMKLWRQEKGHKEEMQRFVAAIQRGETAPIDFAEIHEVMQATFRANRL